MPRSDDDELTDPMFVGATVDSLTHACAWHFKCSNCELETLTDEPVARAPSCPNCERFMAPVNTRRGAA
jgi:hypothetical protein